MICTFGKTSPSERFQKNTRTHTHNAAAGNPTQWAQTCHNARSAKETRTGLEILLQHLPELLLPGGSLSLSLCSRRGRKDASMNCNLGLLRHDVNWMLVQPFVSHGFPTVPSSKKSTTLEGALAMFQGCKVKPRSQVTRQKLCPIPALKGHAAKWLCNVKPNGTSARRPMNLRVM